MWIQFLLEHIHFAAHLFAALVFFAVFWLYADAWQVRRESKELPKLIGLLLLSLSFVVESVVVETTLVPVVSFSGISLAMISSFVRVVGYIVLCYALWADPLQDEPNQVKKSHALLPMSGFFASFSLVFQPILSSVISLLLLRRATVGLEDHLKPLAFAFGLLSISEVLVWQCCFANGRMYRYLSL
jgi:hypothetical protein